MSFTPEDCSSADISILSIFAFPRKIRVYWGLAKDTEPPRHNGDRHYNYPREDAVPIQNLHPDKSATLNVDIATGDIGCKINTQN